MLATSMQRGSTGPLAYARQTTKGGNPKFPSTARDLTARVVATLLNQAPSLITANWSWAHLYYLREGEVVAS
jgi:hypothetical protein